jgi:hypothetical protein
MRRAIGAVLFLIGFSPIAGFLWLWSQHMHVVGFSADARGVVFLSILAAADIGLLCGGIYLMHRPVVS